MAKKKQEPIKIEIELNRDGTSRCHVQHANIFEQAWLDEYLEPVKRQWIVAHIDPADTDKAIKEAVSALT